MTIPKCHTAPGAAGTCGNGYRAPSHDEISEVHPVTAAQAEVLTAWYEVAVVEDDWWRLTVHEWRRVGNLVRLVAEARAQVVQATLDVQGGVEPLSVAVSVPEPRSAIPIPPEAHRAIQGEVQEVA